MAKSPFYPVAKGHSICPWNNRSGPSGWRKYLRGNVRHYEHLDPRKRTTVEGVVQVFAAEKSWGGGAGIDVTEEMKVTVAGQAAVLVPGLEEPYYILYLARANSGEQPPIRSWISCRWTGTSAGAVMPIFTLSP